MKELMHWVTENEAVLTMMTALLTFFLGRYTSYREDYREGRKEINDTFYKPFLELYDNEHHSMAWYYTDLSLEMQNSIMEILLFYLSKMYAGQIKAGESYRILKKCIQVSVLNFERFPDDDFCYRTVHFWDEMAGKKYTDKLEIQILELPKLQKKASGPEDVMEWMRFFRGQNKEELKEVAKGNEYLEGAYEDLVKMSLDEQKRLEYEAREKAILDYRSNMEGARNRGFQRGMEQGFERGITQGEQSMLIQLYRKNRLTLEEAAEEAKMPVEEFQKLVESKEE